MNAKDTAVNPDSHREAALFQAAAQLGGDAREVFLDGACHGDAALRQRLQALLAADEAKDSFLEPEQRKPVCEPVQTLKLEIADAPDETIGQKIGRYKILEKVGEGGCGVVYVAEQTEPVRRRVALKVIKLGMDTKQVVARFEAERQALAMMDHPNIAKVLDAGTTDTGRPYFIMELVRGIRITDYCDQANLTTKERLDLFIKVCQAIQHAHQKGIIHRDIKPSNILVTLHDGVPVPKVIDFGIAKATEGKLTDATVYTQLHQFIGTPAYMSPEQAEMSGLDIDTRSDIYSLGVLLYELLAGSTPFDGQELMSQGIDAMRRTIREREPARPSARLATLSGEDLTTVAKRRSAEAPKLVRQLNGDLDWIVMKCLEKDRTRRYETANGLAADIGRHLANDPITARPPSKLYEFQKTVRRHKFGFAATGAIILVLMVGVALATWQAARARNEATRAKAAEQRVTAALDELRTTAPAFAAQARSLAAKEQFDEAIEKLDYAIKLRPDAPEYLVAKANLLQCQFKLAEAAKVYRQALQVKPGLKDAEASAKLCDELLAAPPGPEGKLSRESLGKLHLAMQKQQRPAAELLPAARLLGAEREHLMAYWLDRLKDLPISPEKPLKDRLTMRDDGLFELDLEDTHVASLKPLVGMPLGKLVLWKSKDIWDFTPLHEMRSLTSLDLGGCQIGNVEMLRGLPLEELYLDGTRVSDLSPLQGMKLKRIGLWGCNRVSDLSPLAGMPLIRFYAVDLATGTDYTPLKGLPLEVCVIGGSSVRDLSFLAATPLKALSINTCASLRGLGWLNQIKTLERLVLPGNFRNLPDEDYQAIAALRTHPRLQFIQADANEDELGSWRAFQVTQPKEIFWQDWDREQTFLPAIRHSGFNFWVKKLPDGTYRIEKRNASVSDLSFLKRAPISHLSLSNCKVQDLTPIRSLPLKELVLGGNPVADLAPLHGSSMPLERLVLSEGTFTDLTPLIGLPLKELYLHHCPNVTDVSVLTNIPTLEMLTVPALAQNIKSLRMLPHLKQLSFSVTSSWTQIPDTTASNFWAELPSLGWLRVLRQADFRPYLVNRLPDRTWEVDLDNTPIRDLSLLAGASISKLTLLKTDVADLTPLRGMPLKELNLQGTKVADLSPLRGMTLKSLNINATPIADLSVLRGMPLTELRMRWCSQITDLSPLAECPKLTSITLPLKARDIGFLRHLPKLQRLSYTENFKENSTIYQPDKTAAQFWKEYDAKSNTTGHQP